MLMMNKICCPHCFPGWGNEEFLRNPQEVLRDAAVVFQILADDFQILRDDFQILAVVLGEIRNYVFRNPQKILRDLGHSENRRHRVR